MLRRWLGVQDSDKLIAGLRRDLEAHGKAHSGVVLEIAQQLNTTSTFARNTHTDLQEQAYRLSVYESNIPAMAKVKRAMDVKAKARQKKAAAEASLAAAPATDEAPEMAVVAEAGE